jgi:hypothetical protein
LSPSVAVGGLALRRVGLALGRVGLTLGRVGLTLGLVVAATAGARLECRGADGGVPVRVGAAIAGVSPGVCAVLRRVAVISLLGGGLSRFSLFG